VPAKGWWHPPHTALACPQFFLLFLTILDKAIGWVGHHGMNGLRGLVHEPLKAVGAVEGGFPYR